MKNSIFDTLDIIAQIDYNYFMLSEIAKSETLTALEVRKYSMGHLRSIIRNKKKLGYDTSLDEAKHAEVKKFKISKQ